MAWLLHVLLVCVIVIPVTVLWLAITVELFRRRDLTGVARLGWLLVLFVLPLIGSLGYVLVTWLRADGVHDLGAPLPAAGIGRHAVEEFGS